MDPLSITTSVASLLVACSQVVRIATDIRGKYKTASLTISSIATECGTVTTALSHLQVLAITRPEPFDSNTTNMFECVMTGCKLTLSVLEEYVTELSEGATDMSTPVPMTVKSKAKVVWNEPEMKELLQQLRGHQSSLTLLLTVLQSQSGTQTQDLLRQNQMALDKILARARTSRRKKPPSSLQRSNFAFADTDSILSDADSMLSATSFEFDDIIINSRVYREALKKSIQRPARGRFDTHAVELNTELDPIIEGGSGRPPRVPTEEASNEDNTSEKGNHFPSLNHKFSFESDTTVKYKKQVEGTPDAPRLAEPSTPKSNVVPDEQSDLGQSVSSMTLTENEPQASSSKKSFDSVNNSGLGANNMGTLSRSSSQNIEGEAPQETSPTPIRPSSEDGALMAPSIPRQYDTNRSLSPAKNGLAKNQSLVEHQKNYCRKCEGTIPGKFVRALGHKFHIDCFTCADCDENIVSKFFADSPAEHQEGSGEIALCEIDFFRRRGLLCATCGGALRGSYIEHLDKKYHLDHFNCASCHNNIDSEETYYEHDGQPYCIYDYATRFADLCAGCHSPILKQFNEIENNGKQQLWHPECHEINKSWNVTLADHHDGTIDSASKFGQALSMEERQQLVQDAQLSEFKSSNIWSSLSAFEETLASCIGEISSNASKDDFLGAVFASKRFICFVESLLNAVNEVILAQQREGLKGMSISDRKFLCGLVVTSTEITYIREAKLWCKKIVALFVRLNKSASGAIKWQKTDQELYSLVNNLARYSKSLIRVFLQGSLDLERATKDSTGLNLALESLNGAKYLATTFLSSETDVVTLSKITSDACLECSSPIETQCAVSDLGRLHLSCITCRHCHKYLGELLEYARWGPNGVACTGCFPHPSPEFKLQLVSTLDQYSFILKVAVCRLQSDSSYSFLEISFGDQRLALV
ncbi:hypothetical protein FQN54_005591 [Arachnomyces sp. PD_36]|nr:hypothetical protein FQN54_005591 [Arachnomyces sp. PD_36]